MATATRTEEQENPLVEGLERLPVHPTTLTIFGATGDLAHRKLLPALYNLAHEGSLPERFNLIGVSRSEKAHEDFRAEMKESIEKYSRTPPKPEVLDALLERAKYIPGVFDDPSVYETLRQTIAEYDEEAGIVFDRIFYLSTAPEFFPVIVKALGEHNLDRTKDTETRVVIEKPFGYDLASARELNEAVLSVFQESQVFRIDHYLGKETVQNIMAFRFANTMFEPVWNRNYIDHVQITAVEDIGIGTRAGYYDGAGALRDLVQNHMMQLLANVCMEPPTAFDADRVRDEKVKVIEAIRPPAIEDVPKMAVRAQYARGRSAGEEVPGYLEEEGVPPDSKTETYAALRLEVEQLALGGRSLLSAHGQAAGPQGDRDRGSAQAGAPPRLPGSRLARRAAQPARAHRPAGRGRAALARGQDPRGAHAHPPREHGVPLRDRLPVAVARGLRAPDHGRDARRRHTVHAQRRGGRALARSSIRSSRPGSRTRARWPSTRQAPTAPSWPTS